MKRLLTSCVTALLLCFAMPAMAQMPDDGFTMGKGELCTVLGYKQSRFKEYWEGTRLRQNLNMGTVTSKAMMPMLGYGITSKLSAFASLPYISNSSNAGSMTGKKGWQDFSLAARYQLFETTHKQWRYTLFGTGSVSLPASNYVPDYLPYSIGLGSKTAALRVVNHIVFKDDFFATIQGGYTWKSNVNVDRITYYTDGQHYTNEMVVPNAWDASVRLGYDNYLVRTNIHYMVMNSVSGSDMRLNDMPYPGNKMEMQAIGVDFLLWVPGVKGLGVNVSADKTIAGRNMGRAFAWGTHVQYVFKPFAKKKKEAKTKK